MEGVFIMNKKWNIDNIRCFVEKETNCKLISTEYLGYALPLEFECSCGNHFQKSWSKFYSSNQRRCQKCSRKQQPKSFDFFEKEVFELVGDEYTFYEYKQANTLTLVKHNTCGNTYNVTPSHFLGGKRCPYCNGGRNLGETAFKKKLDNIYNGEIELIGKFTNMREQTAFKNVIYNVEFVTSPTNVIQGYSTGRKISSGEYAIKTWLENQNIDYQFQFSFSALKRSPFDFYIPSENLAIEYDGEQHFKPIEYFGGKDKLKKQIKNDVRKNYYCASHNIKLIRIPYWKFDKINTILEDAIM